MNATCWWSKEQVIKLQKRLTVQPSAILNLPTWQALVKELDMDESPVPEPMYTVENNLLHKDGDTVSIKPSPNHGGEIDPEIIVIHYTGDNSLQGALSWLCDRRSKVSAHLVIAKTGEIWQLLPFNLRGWHAGKSSYDGRADVNGFSIGIENVGLGDEWPEAQVQANIHVIKALMVAYPSIDDVVGHDDVAPGRKVDPGPRYPWDRVRRETGF